LTVNRAVSCRLLPLLIFLKRKSGAVDDSYFVLINGAWVRIPFLMKDRNSSVAEQLKESLSSFVALKFLVL